jgi:hypothetical protein
MFSFFRNKDEVPISRWTTSSVLVCDIEEISRYLGVPPEKAADGKSVSFRLEEKEWQVELIVRLDAGIVRVVVTAPSQKERPVHFGIKCLQGRIKSHPDYNGDYLWFGTTPGYTNEAGGAYLIIQKNPHISIEASASAAGVPHVLSFDWVQPDSNWH